MTKSLLLLSITILATSSYARPYEEMEKCEQLRPKICGLKGAPTCREVQQKIDDCKDRIREAEVRRINEEQKKKPSR